MVLDLEMLLQVSIKGKVSERATYGVEECLKRLAKKYLGIEKYYYRKPNNERIILKIKSEGINGYINSPCSLFPCLLSMIRKVTNISTQIYQIKI
jgi:hypothetical protein